jgi:TorA maturation chaperone TorD
VTARAELFRALGAMSERPGAAHGQLAEALGLPGSPDAEAYTELFVLQCHPYAAVYLGPEGKLGGEGADQVIGFYRAIGWPVPVHGDHVATLLGLYAALYDAELAAEPGPARARCHRARAVLLQEHLGSWLPVFLDALRLAAGSIGASVYGAWAELTAAALGAEMADLPPADRPPAGHLPRALRVAPDLDADVGLDSLLDGLLAPVRGGVVLTRLDLQRAAADTGVPGRAGERRYTLLAMLGQEPGSVLTWLARWAEEWRARHLTRTEAFGDTARWWAERASATERLLTSAAGALDTAAGR